MTGPLTVVAALLLGFVASSHCVLMCGGITSALGLATGTNAAGRPRMLLLACYQLGRISSYAIAGLLFSSTLGHFVALLDRESVRQGLRVLTAGALALSALVAFGRIRDPGGAIGRRIWPAIAAQGRRLLPVTNPGRALAFGMLWGWMPCGFVYTVLLVATLQADPAQGALTMAAFGAGTAPAMFALALGAGRQMQRWTVPGGRRLVGSLLLLTAAVTLLGPWLMPSLPSLQAWLPFDCTIASTLL